MTDKQKREEQQAYEEELAQHNAIGEYLRKKGKVFNTGDVTPPPLNKDGSLKKDDDSEDVENAFCPTGEGGGVDPSCGGTDVFHASNFSKLTDDDNAVIEDWRGLGLTGERRSEFMKRSGDEFLGILEKLPTYSGLVYQGIQGKSYTVGQIVTDPSPVSTTTDRVNSIPYAFMDKEGEAGKNPTIARITVKTAKALPEDSDLSLKEVLIRPNTSLKVTRIRRFFPLDQKGTRTVTFVEMQEV